MGALARYDVEFTAADIIRGDGVAASDAVGRVLRPVGHIADEFIFAAGDGAAHPDDVVTAGAADKDGLVAACHFKGVVAHIALEHVIAAAAHDGAAAQRGHHRFRGGCAGHQNGACHSGHIQRMAV